MLIIIFVIYFHSITGNQRFYLTVTFSLKIHLFSVYLSSFLTPSTRCQSSLCHGRQELVELSL